MTLLLTHIRGIPYYVKGTDVYTFEMDASGKPSPHCVHIGTNGDTFIIFPDWEERIQSRLDFFRSQLNIQERSSTHIKPQKVKKPKKPKKTRGTDGTVP
jgi:hypothetical protein